MAQGKTQNKSPRRINHKAAKSNTNTGITDLERSVEKNTVGFKTFLQSADFTQDPDATLNTEIHKNSFQSVFLSDHLLIFTNCAILNGTHS